MGRDTEGGFGAGRFGFVRMGVDGSSTSMRASDASGSMAEGAAGAFVEKGSEAARALVLPASSVGPTGRGFRFAAFASHSATSVAASPAPRPLPATLFFPPFFLTASASPRCCSPLRLACSTTSFISSPTLAYTPTIILALRSNAAQSPSHSLPASPFSALAGFGWMSRHPIVTSTSRSVSSGRQSRFSVSTQTAPLLSSMFGCQMRVLNAAVGGWDG